MGRVNCTERKRVSDASNLCDDLPHELRQTDRQTGILHAAVAIIHSVLSNY
jgi:hypothetical protein